jgi:hypothetical protein
MGMAEIGAARNVPVFKKRGKKILSDQEDLAGDLEPCLVTSFPPAFTTRPVVVAFELGLISSIVANILNRKVLTVVDSCHPYGFAAIPEATVSPNPARGHCHISEKLYHWSSFELGRGLSVQGIDGYLGKMSPWSLSAKITALAAYHGIKKFS